MRTPGCLDVKKLKLCDLCQGLFRYKQYNTYFYLNPPEEFVDLDGIIEIVYFIDKKMSDQLGNLGKIVRTGVPTVRDYATILRG